MKKHYFFILSLILSLILYTSFHENMNYQTNNENVEFENNDEILKKYQAFLDGKLSIQGIDIDYITIPTGEPEKRYTAKYAFYDSNADSIPELHIKSARYYYAFTQRDGELVVWTDWFDSSYIFPLTNGAFLVCRWRNMDDFYSYFILDNMGNKIFSLSFSKYDANHNHIFDENDEYSFNDVEVKKQQFYKLTEDYLYLDEKGREEVKNEIEWTTLFE